MRYIIITVLSLAVSGCCEYNSPETRLGRAQRVDFHTSSFNACDVTVIHTDTDVVMLCGRFSVELGAEIYRQRNSCGGSTVFMRTRNGNVIQLQETN